MCKKGQAAGLLSIAPVRAIWMKPLSVCGLCSSSLPKRRQRPSQANVRPATQRRGRTQNPFWPSGLPLALGLDHGLDLVAEAAPGPRHRRAVIVTAGEDV